MRDYFAILGLVVVCSAVLAWLACRCRQPVIIGYFLCGVIVGPWGLGLVSDVELLQEISRIGIALLLFLAGLVLHPHRLAQLFGRATIITLGGYLAGLCVVFPFLLAWGYGTTESLIAAAAFMFSSTILAVKLLPTTTLHQKHMGSLCIAVLIAQDVTAVGLILCLSAVALTTGTIWSAMLTIGIKGGLLIVTAVLFEQFVLRRMMRSTETFNEVSVALCMAWCLGLAVVAKGIGLSYEVGAFLAGVTMARTKMAYFLSEQLKPLRDFFLMLFFVVLGAGLNLPLATSVLPAAILVGALILVTRPIYYRWLLRMVGEERDFSTETGFRLGQASEFSLLLALVASGTHRMSDQLVELVQLATIVTMVVSSYVVVLKFPTPLGVRPGLKKD